MNDYNFLNLSPFEFENISRDLLQEKLGVFIESFTSGKDEGIDLRIATDEAHTIIIQAKRYDKYATLKAVLKKEVAKVYDLRPERYIVTTSIGLTPANKAEIHALFFPYIQSTDDILGKDDLNNLLGQFPNIERNYYKLWLSSVAVLNKVIHSTVYNQSAFELDAIQQTLQVYVQNESFMDALAILKQHRYVIISGIPGIGKTTLARMLVYHLLAQGYDEFVYVSESINEGYAFYEEHKKQVLFFDDFLGKNFLDTKLGINEDHKLLTFIERVKQSKNTFFILTTREYILNQAKNTYENLNKPAIDIAKCTVDIATYTRFIRAEILYNHLFFAKIPVPHLSNLIAKKRYLEVVSHPNYNPRIIETFVQHQFWEACTPETFTATLLTFFNNPKSVWQHVYEHSISKGAQIVLLVITTLGTPVLLEDLKIAVTAFITAHPTKYAITLDTFSWNRILKELESTFINTIIDTHTQIAIAFQNPSIQDFLVYYMSDKEELLQDLIHSFVFTSQFFTLFTITPTEETSYKIQLSKTLFTSYIQKLNTAFHQFKNATIHSVYTATRFKWYKYEDYYYTFLHQLITVCQPIPQPTLDNYIREKFLQNPIPHLPNHYEKQAYLSLFRYFKEGIPKHDLTAIIKAFTIHMTTLESLQDFSALATVFPIAYQEYIQSTSFIHQVRTIVTHEIKNRDAADMSGLLHELKNIQVKFQIPLHQEFLAVTAKCPNMETEIHHNVADEMEQYAYFEAQYAAKKEKEEQEITNLFESLLALE